MRPMNLATRRSVYGVLPLLLGIACSSSSSSAVAPHVGLSVAGDLPDGCLSDLPQPRIVWSADGSEIYYAALEIKAAKADGSGTRVVQTATGNDESFGALASPADGSAVYYTVDGKTPATSYTISEALTGEALPGTVGALLMAASRDDRRLAYGWNSLSVYDIPAGGSTPLGSAPNASAWSALAFSPDGNQLFAASFTGTAMTFDLAANQVVSTPVQAMYGGMSANWNEAGARLFFSDGHVPVPTYQIQNVTTGTITPVTPPMKTTATSNCSGWSPDGATVAFWSTSCTDGATVCVPGGDNYRTDLYLADASSGATTWVAGLGDSAPDGDIAFSPDGSQIAYVWDNSLYVSAVP